jgi:hypothetical protein
VKAATTSIRTLVDYSVWLKDRQQQVGALVGIVTSLSTSVALPFTLQWVLSSLSPLSTMISSSRGLEIVGALNHLMLCVTEPP